jgi:DNA-3-methyladenine glycosylase I
MTYCEYIDTITGDQLHLHKEYHDNHCGFPLQNDDLLYERVMFEINQAGLNLEKSRNKNEEKRQTD